MIQLIPKGPKIPEELHRLLIYDNLVFFCGSGISKSNGLPLFDELAEKICENLKLNKDDPLLQIAKEKKDYASTFDLLESGQIPHLSVKSKILRKEIIKILSAYKKDQFENHKALLELSALPNDEGNRLVTTNFDRLFFKAGLESKFSDSAPKLAPPRKEIWKNLTFLHGVIDKKNDPEGKNLIITRRDFGQAYLYDTWASRFIIRLFQDFTVLFIGYSANDPVMSYLVSVISYENQRRRENENSENCEEISKKKERPKPSIYAFVGYEEGNKKKEEDKWKQLGVEPVPYKIYKIKEKENHSLLYETIKEWVKLKTGRRSWLKQQLTRPYKKEIDKQKAETVISTLKMDKKLAEYLPDINLSSDPKKRKPVDINWLKAFAEEKKEPRNENQTNSFLSISTQQVQTENSLLKKMTRRTVQSQPYSLWEPLSPIEKNIAKWLLHHLDKKELIHWLIKQAPLQTGLISLHPEFKEMLKWQLKTIQKNSNQQLDKRKTLFWKIVSTQKENSKDIESFHLGIPISDLNKNYSYEKAKKFLSYLEPMISFETSFYIEKFKQFTGPDKIYKTKLAINASHYPSTNLTNEKTLLFMQRIFLIY